MEEKLTEKMRDEQTERIRQAFQKGDYSGICMLSDWVCVWLRDVLPNVVKGTTIQMYAETMERHILVPLGKKELKSITEQTVREWAQALAKMPLPGTKQGRMTEGTLRNTLSVLSGCLRDAQKYGLIDRNPCTNVAWTLKYKNVEEEQSWLNEEQLLRLEPVLAAYHDRSGYPAGIGFQLMLYTGITLSEAVSLRWKDVDYAREMLTLREFQVIRREAAGSKERRSYEMEALKGRRRREIPMPGFLMRELKEVQTRYGGKPEDFVLCGSDQKPAHMDRLRMALAQKGESCGIKGVTPGLLRDTYVMRAVRAGASSDTIAELIGYASSRQVIRRYMPRTVTDKRELVKKMFGE